MDSGQPQTVSTLPVTDTSLAGKPASARRFGALGPQTIAAVLAAFASTQLDAATETRLQHSRAFSPVAGSTMW